MFMDTGWEVRKKTNDAQVPWISSSALPPYYLAGKQAEQTEPAKIRIKPQKQTTAAVTYIYEAATGNITELGNRYRVTIHLPP